MEDFPRGGSLPENTVKSRTKKWFFSGPPVARTATLNEKLKTEDYASSVWTDKLTYKCCPTDLISLACVRSCLDDHLILELPDAVRARLPFKDISQKFFGTIMAASEDADIPSVAECFPPGLMLSCRVVGRPSSDCSRRKDMYLSVSTEPALVNSHMTVGSVEENMVIAACVTSVEDKGYIMDIGFTNVCGFLPHTSCSIERKLMIVGRPLLCRVVSSYTQDKRVVELSSTEGDIFSAKFLCSGMSKNQFSPGTAVQATVEKVLDKGLLVSFPSGLNAFVLFQHFRYLTTRATSYGVGDSLPVVTMLFVPNSIVIGLSAEAALIDRPSTLQQFHAVKVGDCCKGRVVGISPNDGVFMKLAEGVFAHASKNLLELSGGETVEKKYPKSSSHRCRVIGESLFSCHFYISFKKADLRQAFSTLEEAQPGTKLSAVVERATSGGVFVTVYKRFRGYIPPLFASDVLPGKVNVEKFSKGRKLKVQIVYRNPERKQLVLTCRRMWMQSDDPIISNYSSENVGLLTTGVIIAINPNGLLLCFYGQVKGFLRRKLIAGAEKDSDWNQMFHLGQLLRVRVLFAREQKKHMLVGPASDKSDRQEMHSKVDLRLRKRVMMQPLTEEFYAVSVAEVMEVCATGLKVRFQKKAGFVPSFHLTDTLSLAHLLCSTYRVGEQLPKCVLFRNDRLGVSLVTAKPAIVESALSKTLIRDFEQLLPNTVVHGVIGDYSDRHGFFIDLPGYLSVRCPKCHIEGVDQMTAVIGSTVVCKVQHVDNAKKFVTVNMKLNKCLRIGGDYAMKLLDQYLLQMVRIVKHFRECSDATKARLSKLKVGDPVECTVMEVASDGLVCSLEEKIGVIVNECHIDKTLTSYKVGQSVQGVVLYIDFERSCIEVATPEALQPWGKAPAQTEGLQIGQALKATVVLVKPDFILVCLKQYEPCQLCYLPSRVHYCDLSYTRSQYHIGSVVNVVVKRVSKNHVVVFDTHVDEVLKRVPSQPLAVVEPPGSSDLGGVDRSAAWFYPHLGKKFRAIVLSIKNGFMRLQLGGKYTGRLHATELSDKFENGSRPLDAYHVGQQVSVKIIGYQKKRRTTLGDSRVVRMGRTECSMKPSKLTSENNKKAHIYYRTKFSVGDMVPVFITKITDKGVRGAVNPLWKGVISFFHFPRKKDSPLDVNMFCQENGIYSARVVHVNKAKHVLRLSFLEASQEKALLFVPTIARVTRLTPLAVMLVFPDGVKARCSIVDISDNYNKTAAKLMSLKVRQRVLVYPFKQIKSGTWFVSMRPSHLTPSLVENVRDKFVTANEMKVGTVLRGFVALVQEKALIVSLAFNCGGIVPIQMVSRYIVADLQQAFRIGTVVTVKVKQSTMKVGTASAKTLLSMLEADTGVADQLPVAMRGEERRAIKKEPADLSYEVAEKVFDANKSASKDDTSLAEIDVFLQTNTGRKRKATAVKENDVDQGEEEEDIFSQLKRASSFNWQSERFSMNNLMNVGLEAQPTTATSSSSGNATSMKAPNAEEQSSSDEEQEAVIEASQPAKKKNKFEREKIEEEEILKKEMSLMDPDKPLNTVEDFDRLLLGSPSSSMLWLRYMAFFLQTADVDKARSVAERALKTIPAAEETERFNIWVALFNLENLYGTKDSFAEVIERARAQNDHLKVYTHLLKIYKKSQKIEEGDALVQDMLRKYKALFDVWVLAGEYYMESKRPELARSLMKRALKSLPASLNIDVVSRFAQMEFKWGDAERGRTLFENLVQDFPKRTNVWLVYIDMLVKYLGIEAARPIFEKVTSSKFSAHKMRTFYQKWLNIEERYGSDDVIDQVKERAATYLKNLTDALATENEQEDEI